MVTFTLTQGKGDFCVWGGGAEEALTFGNSAKYPDIMEEVCVCVYVLPNTCCGNCLILPSIGKGKIPRIECFIYVRPGLDSFYAELVYSLWPFLSRWTLHCTGKKTERQTGGRLLEFAC